MSNKKLYKVNVNLKALESVGCDFNLEGHLVELVKDYPDGYMKVLADVSQLIKGGEKASLALGRPITLNFDLPKRWLTIVDEFTYKFTYKDIDGILKFKNITVDNLDNELAIAKFEKENPEIVWRGLEYIKN